MEIKARFDHFNINVTDLERSLAFYDRALGLKEISRKQADDGSFILAYLGDGETGFRLELTWLRDHAATPYELGENESHLCVRVAGDYEAVRAYHKELGCVCFENHEMGLYFINDPDDYWIEVLPLNHKHNTAPGNRSAPGVSANSKNIMATETMEQAVTEAVRILREGGVILYPTDTVWGIGCDATNAEAVERIYRLKRSENKKSMLVLCATPDMVVRYVHKAPGIAFEVQELATKPLTLILPGASGVAANLIPEEGTLGVRIPDHAFCQAMLRKLGRPIVSTSANISGEDTPRNLAEISREIIDGVDYVVNPKFEGKPTGKASSILLFNEAGEFRIIRE